MRQRPSTRPRLALTASALAVVLLATGCTSDGGIDGSNSSTTLTIGTPGFPASLDPATGDNANSDFYNLTYDPLIVAAPDGTFQPGLATDWEYGPENRSFSITLRPDVKFSDGEPLDAEAVKVWLEHAMELPGGRAPIYLGNLDSIEVTGPLTLTIHFSAPAPLLELTFSQVLEMGMIGSPKAVEAGTLATETAGAGPYMLDPSQTVVRDTYVFVPNPRYWNKDAVHWERVVIRVIQNPSAMLQALRTGQVQVAKDQPASSIDAAEDAGLHSVGPPTLLMGLALLDRDGSLLEPVGDRRVRQAINHAIDREAITNAITSGHGSPIYQMAAPGDDSYNDELEDAYPYDPDRARELLAEAGYADGFTMPVLSLAAVDQDTIGQAVAGQLAEVGITVELDVKSNADEYIRALAEGAFPVATISFGRLPAAINYQLLWGPSALPFNPFQSSNDTINELHQQMLEATSDQVPVIGAQIQEVLVQEAWFAPVSANPLVVLYRPEVTDVNASPDRTTVYAPEIAPAS